jgi:hypothetical protein
MISQIHALKVSSEILLKLNQILFHRDNFVIASIIHQFHTTDELLIAQASCNNLTFIKLFLYCLKFGKPFSSFSIFKHITEFQTSLNSAEITFSESTGVFAKDTIDGGTFISQDQSLGL